MELSPEAFDLRMRIAVYQVSLQRGYPSTMAEVSSHLQVTATEVSAAFKRLATDRVLVLQPENGETLMANPFSAVPTPFLVQTDTHACY